MIQTYTRAILFAFLCFALTACSTADLADRALLRVGTSGDYPPFSRAGEGFDIDIAREFARDTGYRIEWVAFRWPDLERDLMAGRFDVAMGGVTWRAYRDLRSPLSRGVAVGGPCVIGEADPDWVAVNRGGILERWAHEHFRNAHIVAVDDNLVLPELLAGGDVDTIVTDSFEVRAFARPGDAVRCAPALDVKAYWISPAAPPALRDQLDTWIAGSEAELQKYRVKWFGEAAPREEIDHLLDLIGRRLALMPAVARYKRARGIAIEDPARETTVIAASLRESAALGLAPDSIRALFELQIELAKSVQRDTPAGAGDGEASVFDLETELRPALLRIGANILTSLDEVVPIDPDALTPQRMQGIFERLTTAQRARLRAALLAVRRVPDKARPVVRDGRRRF